MKKGKTMKMSTLCVTILAAAVYCGAFAALGDSLGNIGDVRLKGRLGERLDAMIEKHVAARDVDYITAPFMEKTEQKGSDLIATVNYHSKETWRQQTE